MPSLSVTAARLHSFERRHWVAFGLLAAVVALNLFIGFSLFGENSRAVAKIATNVPRPGVAASVVAPPQPEPLQFQSVAPQEAVAINAAVPLVSGPNPAARPFTISAKDGAETRARALDCLTSAIYYEAATEPADGQRAVAQVVLNRVRHPAFPSSVCGVVYQGSERATGCQFTFTCDGALRRLPMQSYWERARKIAEEALSGKVYAPVGLATHYHTNWVVPYWSSSLAKVANVGTHIFYRWSGGWGRPPAFVQRYAAAEPAINLAALRSRVPQQANAVDLAAAEAAEAAKADPAGADKASVDSFQRAVLRRYEPIQGPAVAKLLADQAGNTDPADKDSSSHRWAMTGDGGLGTSGAPLGRAQEAKKVEPASKPVAPMCLSGVRKVGEAQPASCGAGS